MSVPKPNAPVKRVSGARVLTSAKCAAILEKREEKKRKEKEEREKRKLEREKKKLEKEKAAKKKQKKVQENQLNGQDRRKHNYRGKGQNLRQRDVKPCLRQSVREAVLKIPQHPLLPQFSNQWKLRISAVSVIVHMKMISVRAQGQIGYNVPANGGFMRNAFVILKLMLLEERCFVHDFEY